MYNCFYYPLKVDLSDSENDIEDDGIDDTTGGGGRADPTVSGGTSSG